MSPIAALAARTLAASTALFSSSAPPAGLVLHNSVSGGTVVASFADTAGRVLTLESGASGLVPITVVRTKEWKREATCDWVKGEVERFRAADEVFFDAFLEYIYLDGPTTYETGLAQCLKNAYNTSAVLSCNGSPETVKITAHSEASLPVSYPSLLPVANLPSRSPLRPQISSGPYVLHLSSGSGTLGKIYRLHRDTSHAFMSSLLPSLNSSFVPSPFNTESDGTQGVAVPSRVYSLDADKDGEEKPLKGLRVAVKDIVDVKGVRTSMGSRAWFDVYGPREENAPAIQRLIDLGVEIVGKTVTAQHANNDRPTADWVDYHDAFNPRGDGYQDPGASSAGSGAAIASYEWLDVTIGTDTGGSVRIPSSYNGVYGIRPSFGSLSVEGVLPEGPYFDVVGYHTRSPYLFQSFGKAWMGSTHKSYPSLPKTVHVPDDLFPVSSTAAQAIYDDWIEKLAAFLDAQVDTRNISVFWAANETAPERQLDMFDYLHTVGFDLEWKYQYDTVFAPFEEAYAEKYDGRLPFKNPTVAARIGYYQNATQERFDEARKRQLQFKEFFEGEVVTADEESCSSGLWLTPSNPGRVGYINNYPIAAPTVNETALTFSQLYYSVFSGAPEVVIPIGQVPYNSTISGVVEYSPVTIDVLARPGCDYVLLDLVAQLADAGLVKEVKTGRTAF
ncbi:hypothetical protein JCM6882_009226 [Rhodosporidiobolus microsporus]